MVYCRNMGQVCSNAWKDTFVEITCCCRFENEELSGNEKSDLRAGVGIMILLYLILVALFLYMFIDGLKEHDPQWKWALGMTITFCSYPILILLSVLIWKMIKHCRKREEYDDLI